MKKNKIFSALSVLAAVSVFTGCFTGTDMTNSFEDVRNRNTTTVVNNGLSYTSSVSAGTETLQANRTNNEVSVVFTSEFEIDEDTLSAVTFNGLTAVENDYSTETPLTSTLKNVTSATNSSTLTTTAYFDVDLTNYNKAMISVRVDAATLKDVKGNCVLNLNKNETAGEASDSYLGSYVVNKNANNDDFAEDITRNAKPSYSTITFSVSASPKTADTIGIVGLQYSIDGWYENLKLDYNKTSADKLNSIYKLQTIAPGDSKWTPADESILTFAWNETDSAYEALIPIASLPAGTKYRVVEKMDSSVAFTQLGVESYVTYKKYDDQTEYKVVTVTGTSGTSKVYDISTTTIVSTAAYSSAAECNPDTVQDGLATVSKTALSTNGYGARFEISFDNLSIFSDGTNTVGLVASDGFIVTTNETYGYKSVPCTVTVVEKNTAGATKVVVTTNVDTTAKDAVNYLASDLLVWVGSNVKISSNELNPQQTCFGTYKDAAKGDASGYVQLN